MDEKKKRLLLIVGGAIALAILAVILFLFVMGGEEGPVPPPPPPPVTATEPEFGEELASEVEAARVERLTTSERTSLQTLAARPDVYGNATQWWTLFAANPGAVRYLLELPSGKLKALVPPHAEIKVPAPHEVSMGEQTSLRRRFGAYAVQFGSYAESANATHLIEQLRAGEPDMDFYISLLTVDGIPRHRVRAGLFSRWGDAEAFGRDVDQRYEEVEDYYVVAVPARERSERDQALDRLYK